MLDSEVLVESLKSIMGAGYEWDLERDIFTQAYTAVGGFDLRAYKSGRAGYTSLRRKFDGALRDILERLEAGAIGRHEAMMEFSDVASDMYKQAFRFGAMRAGNPYYKDIGITALDAKFTNVAKGQEARFFSRFLDQVLGGESRIAPVTRASYYAKGLDALFWDGFVAGAGEEQIHWELGVPVGDHCLDCLEIAAGSPYTYETVPTVPRAGDTQCLHNCYCTLVTVRPGAGPEQPGGFDGLGAVGPEVSRTGLEGSAAIVQTLDGMPVSASIARLFSDLYAQLFTTRGKMAFATGDEKRLLIAQRKLLNSEIIKLQDAYRVRVVPRYSVSDVVRVTRSLRDKGLEIVKEVWQCPF